MDKSTPVALSIAGEVRSLDGSPPPGISELVLQTDRGETINSANLPACNPSPAKRKPSDRKGCDAAIIGEGTARVLVANREDPGEPLPVEGDLLVYNGRARSGEAILNLELKLPAPLRETLIKRVRVQRSPSGPYGGRLRISIPAIDGGAASLHSFRVAFKRHIAIEGERRSVISLRCPTGKISTLVRAALLDGSVSESEVVRPCAGRG